MDLRRYRLLGTFLTWAVLLTPSLAAAADDDDDGDAEAGEAAEDDYVEPDAWERPPVEEEKAPPPKPKAAPVVRGDGRDVSIGLLIGYGFGFGNALGSDPYSLGFGLRGGYTLDFGLYIGGSASYFLGTSNESNSGGGTGTAGTLVKSSASYMQILAEVGYDIWVSKLVIRPYVGLGVGLGLVDGTTLSSPVSSFSFAPGAAVFYTIDAFFIGGDLRFNMMGGNGVDGATISVLGGLRF